AVTALCIFIWGVRIMGRETEIVRIPVRLQNQRKMLRAIESGRSGYLSAPACRGLKVLTNAQQDELVLIITWESAEAHDESLRGPHCAAFFEGVVALAAGPPQTARYQPAIDEQN
ncbi:MAG TPA: antibiotic biosynthesis monooxygenase, partial [Candidatus Udaeobacter sp.]|nr:antibiotic biosynthesis monooxygenase [Candidatus Udaeobacter sp.]